METQRTESNMRILHARIVRGNMNWMKLADVKGVKGLEFIDQPNGYTRSIEFIASWN